MNRVLKFRCWDAINKQMIPHENIGVGVKNINRVIGKKQFFYMQFTGLTDKNGKEIYENDIVKNIAGDIGKVVYICWEAFSGFAVEGNGRIFRALDKGIFNNLEIIGNIYEEAK